MVVGEAQILGQVKEAFHRARRLGIFSQLNMDFTLALGSSSVTLYELTRAFGVIGRLGQRLSPIFIRKVLDSEGKEIAKASALVHEYLTIDEFIFTIMKHIFYYIINGVT